MGLLDTVRILDLSRLLPGPACTWYLAGMGASVDRVEPPGAGDMTRSLPPFLDGVGAFYAALNAGDRSLALDLRHPQAREVVLALVPHYDVLVEGFKPGVLEAMGLGPQVLAAHAPRLIVARLSGYGQTGPWALRAGHDINYVGLAGLLAGAAPHQDGPGPMPVQAADMAGALTAAMGICAALFERERTGRGRVLDVSLSEAALSLNAPHVTTTTAEGRGLRPGGELLTGLVPIYGTYRCADGRYLTVGALEPKFQQRLLAQVGTVERAALREAFLQQPRDVWVQTLAEACTGPVLDVDELASHPHLADRGAVQRLARATFVRPPLADGTWTVGRVASLGEHTDSILAEAGLAVAALRAARVVA